MVKQNAAVDLAQKDKVADFGHVDAGGEQVHGDRHIGQSLVSKALEQAQRLVGIAGDFDDGVVFDTAVLGFKGCFKHIDHQVGMVGIDAKDQSFAQTGGVDFLRQVVAHRLVEGSGDDFSVEVFHIQIDVVWRFEQVNLVAPGVIHLELFAHFPVHAVLRQFGVNLDGWLVVH